jgi:hypothetical protein
MRREVMQILRTLFALLLVLLAQSVRAQNFTIEESSAEETAAPPPFSITRVEPADNGLRVFLNTDNPAAVSDLLFSGALQAQLSDNQLGTETAVPISFGKAVRCTADADPVYLGYPDPLPDCAGQPPATIEYFFRVSAALGPDRDLAIGDDPDYLWLIAEE